MEHELYAYPSGIRAVRMLKLAIAQTIQRNKTLHWFRSRVCAVCRVRPRSGQSHRLPNRYQPNKLGTGVKKTTTLRLSDRGMDGHRRGNCARATRLLNLYRLW